METKNKIALVTGGSRGLGKDMAMNIAAKGNDVIITYHSKKEEALKVVEAIRKMGNNASMIQLNASDINGLDVFFNELKTTLKHTFGTDRFDFLVNNAGTSLTASFGDTTEDQFDEVMNIHFKSVFFLTQKALSLLNDGGRIINISSGLTRFSMPGYSAYGSMKGAVEVLTRYLAKELGSRKINVNVVAPGAIETDFGGGRVRDNKELNAHIAGITALGRVGVAEDIGSVVAFLCSEEARWINGQRIEVSGGMNL